MRSLLFAIASIAILESTPSFRCRAFNAAPAQPTQQQQHGRPRAPMSTPPSSTAVFSRGDDGDDVANGEERSNTILSSRRSFMATASAVCAAAATVGVPFEADAAAPDCLQDCLKNCKLIAPKDPQYCQDSCQEYCDQPDRADGLSGSVSSEGGETGILGTSTVVRGEDKPPEVKLPGLDFTSGNGRKLLGY